MKTELIKEMVQHGEIAEVKRIYSMIETTLAEKRSACLVITSGSQGEGKTTITAGLSAYAARQNKKRVLAIDLNWYSPELHNCFDVDPFFDLEEFKQAGSVENLVQPSNVPGLDILAAVKPMVNGCGTSEDVHMLSSEMIKSARKSYDFIVVDTSSVFPTNRYMVDPTIISKHADCIALVTLANVTPRQKLKRTTMSLETSGATVLGVIVNQWRNPMYK